MGTQRWMATACAAVVIFLAGATRAEAAECADLWDWLNTACRRLADTYDKGGNELIVSGYTWHTPWTWTAEKRAEENANAWGAGWGRTVERENGDTDTVYFLVFSDSHSKPEYNLGYAWNTFWGPRSGIQPGLGYTASFVARSDHRQRLAVSRGAADAFAALRQGDAHQRVHSQRRRRRQPRQRLLRVRQDRPRLSAGR